MPVLEQEAAVGQLLAAADASFEQNWEASERLDWCSPVPLARKVETAQAFLQAFHNEETLEVATCAVCYLKREPRDLDRVDWRRAFPANVRRVMPGLLACKSCFPDDDASAVVLICSKFRTAFDRHQVPDLGPRSGTSVPSFVSSYRLDGHPFSQRDDSYRLDGFPPPACGMLPID